MNRAHNFVLMTGWILTACGGAARPTSSWADATKRSFHPARTVVAFMTTDYSVRRVVEDRLAAQLPGGIPSYRLIPQTELMAMDAVQGRLTTLGFTGVLVLRLAADTSRPTANSTAFYDYWDKWRSAYTPPDSGGVNRQYAFETTLYSVRDGRMIWMARSEPIRPTDVEKLKEYSVNFAIGNLRESGYVR